MLYNRRLARPFGLMFFLLAAILVTPRKIWQKPGHDGAR